MKHLHRHLLAAGLLAGLGLAAVAQTQAPAAQAVPHAQQSAHAGAHHGTNAQRDPAERRARMEARRAARLSTLKEKLQITGDQEGAWTAWTAAMKPAAFQRPARRDVAAMTTPERIERMRALHAARAARMDQRMDATQAFYAALAPAQQKVFDAESARLMRGGKGMRGGHGRHHRS